MYLQMALRNLGRAKVRSILAAIGVIIGVTAIASIGIFGESLKNAVLENFKDLANEVIISPSRTHGYTVIDERTLMKIEKAPYIAEIIPVKSAAAEITSKKRTISTVYGLDEDDAREMFKAESGRISFNGRCVVGKMLAEALELRVGSKIYVNGKLFKVSAILEAEGARFDINPNYAVIISQEDFDKIFGDGYDMIIVKVKSIEDVSKFKEYVESRVNYKEKVVDVFEMKSILERIERAFAQINLFLMAIAGVSLLVAGVSILNVMLMSTIERTKEIGILRAIGAQRSDVLKIFLYEALILGVFGSVIGACLSFVAGYGITSLIVGKTEYVFSLSSALYAFFGLFFGIFTALISGLYPAYRASKLDPIVALRFE